VGGAGRADGSVAMPVFRPGGRPAAAVELAFDDVASRLGSVRAALVVATGSLSRQLATPTEPTSSGASLVAYHS
jgi:hypothetical protein